MSRSIDFYQLIKVSFWFRTPVTSCHCVHPAMFDSYPGHLERLKDRRGSNLIAAHCIQEMSRLNWPTESASEALLMISMRMPVSWCMMRCLSFAKCQRSGHSTAAAPGLFTGDPAICDCNGRCPGDNAAKIAVRPDFSRARHRRPGCQHFASRWRRGATSLRRDRCVHVSLARNHEQSMLANASEGSHLIPTLLF